MRHDLFRFSGEDIPDVAISVSWPRCLGFTHSAITYRNGDGLLRQIDFRVPGYVCCEDWDGNSPYAIIDFGIDEDARQNLSVLCELIDNRYRFRWNSPRHPYGFRKCPTAFVDTGTGQLFLGTGEVSCSNFVLIVLESSRIELVASRADWQQTRNDEDVQLNILETFQGRLGGDAINRILDNLPQPRVSPEQIMGAVMYPNVLRNPAPQVYCDHAGQWIRSLLDACDTCHASGHYHHPN